MRSTCYTCRIYLTFLYKTVIATDIEPIPGWINNIYGPTGVVAATGIGLMRCIHTDPKQIANIVPGDYVSNAVLACAWDIHNQW